ncbi:hypothetical protein ACMHY1_004503 [Vibrio alginolyticus]
MIVLEKDNLAPYLSILLGFKGDDKTPCDIHSNIIKIIQDETSDEISMSSTFDENIGEIGTVKITPYKLLKKPSWLINHDAKDVEHHVAVSFNVNNYFAFYFSEKGKKDEIREFFGKKSLSNLSPISINHLNSNFINEDKVKMLWLSGIHGKNNFKADSKVLGGESVADTLDPLIDQSYMMSAVRTELWKADSKTTVGINPFKSSIWRGPCKNWKTFENRVVEILDLLYNNQNQVSNPISILSYPIASCNDLDNPYDFSLIDYEFFPEEDGQHRKELLRRLHYDYSVELKSTFNGNDVLLDVFHKNKKIGDILAEPIISDYQVTFNIKSENAINKKHLDEYKKIFRYPEIIKCWFESGHAIINGMVFKTGYQDIEYNRFLWADYEDYDVKKEKPGSNPTKPDLKNIGNEKSLFCWVRNCWSGEWLTQNEFNTTEKPSGWLYCDDGAGEKADFIHYVEFKGLHLISLIHVKAAKSDSMKRLISVGAHDVVLNQGVKNLRYCARKTLVTDLKERLDGATDKECWFNNKKAKPSDFLTELEAISGVSTVRTRVIVVQPHTLRSVYEDTKSSKIKKQLDVLLVSADNAIRSSGSEFHIIGFDNRNITKQSR